MYCIIDNTTDPYWNLACEEYLLKYFDQPVFRLWRNENSVIIGRNQNALSEIDMDFVRREGVKVVRRLTGGGAVFHDLGNINFSFASQRIKDEDTIAMFRRFTAPVIDALRDLGIPATLEGRNDLTIDGRKFSGNAICIHQDRILQHGTLLFSSSISNLSGALKVRPEKFSDKAVKSNRSRVTNISEHLPEPMTVEQFIDYLRLKIGRSCETYQYSAADLQNISRLAREKYSTPEWNFGHSPRYSFHRCEKLSGGMVEVMLQVEGGVIREIAIYGDYFFCRPSSEICALLQGCPHTYEKIAERLSTVTFDDYFCGISAADFVRLFF